MAFSGHQQPVSLVPFSWDTLSAENSQQKEARRLASWYCYRQKSRAWLCSRRSQRSTMGKHKIALDLLEVLAAHPSKKQRIFGPAKKMKRSAAARPSAPKPFTKADAKALYHQIKDFEKEYRDEGYKVPNNLVRSLLPAFVPSFLPSASSTPLEFSNTKPPSPKKKKTTSLHHFP